MPSIIYLDGRAVEKARLRIRDAVNNAADLFFIIFIFELNLFYFILDILFKYGKINYFI